MDIRRDAKFELAAIKKKLDDRDITRKTLEHNIRVPRQTEFGVAYYDKVAHRVVKKARRMFHCRADATSFFSNNSGSWPSMAFRITLTFH